MPKRVLTLDDDLVHAAEVLGALIEASPGIPAARFAPLIALIAADLTNMRARAASGRPPVASTAFTGGRRALANAELLRLSQAASAPKALRLRYAVTEDGTPRVTVVSMPMAEVLDMERFQAPPRLGRPPRWASPDHDPDRRPGAHKDPARVMRKPLRQARAMEGDPAPRKQEKRE